MAKKDSVDQYTHPDSTRTNNPPAGLVTLETDPDRPSKHYSHDPRLDPHLQWSGKRENSEFEVDTVSLHVHETVDPATILEKAMQLRRGGGWIPANAVWVFRRAALFASCSRVLQTRSKLV